MKTICLNMIVKNESRLISRCLRSVRPVIDCWVIVDTGSTDGTQERICTALADLPGQLYERPWVDFSHNRNEALRLARGRADYALIIDADERLCIDSFDKESLTLDSYLIEVCADEGSSCRIFLLNNHPGWLWVGALHECVGNSEPVTNGRLRGVTIDCKRVLGQHPKTREKYLEDAKVLASHLRTPRDVYYLAQSYACAGEYALAVQYYLQRTTLGAGWEPDEIFWSYYTSGTILEERGAPPAQFLLCYERANEERPERAEPLYRIASYYSRRGWDLLARLLAEWALTLPEPTTFLVRYGWLEEELRKMARG